MRWKTAVLGAVAALAFAATGCKAYDKQGSAQRVGQGEGARAVPGDDGFRNSTGVHGDRNTLDGRTGVFNASGRRGAPRNR